MTVIGMRILFSKVPFMSTELWNGVQSFSLNSWGWVDTVLAMLYTGAFDK